MGQGCRWGDKITVYADLENIAKILKMQMSFKTNISFVINSVIIKSHNFILCPLSFM